MPSKPTSKKTNKTSFSSNPLYQWILLAVVVIGLGWLLYNRVSQNNSQTYGEQSSASVIPMVHFVLITPSDMQYDPANLQAIERAAANLQAWYGGQLGGHTFHYQVEHYLAPAGHTSAYYRGDGGNQTYWNNSLADGFYLSGGRMNDPTGRWVYINAGLIGEGQTAGGNMGVALLHGADLIGLASSNPNRYIGGMGHELGHTFTLPHTVGCPDVGDCSHYIMVTGYLIYPRDNTGPVIFNDAEKHKLLTSPEVAQFFMDNPPPQRKPIISTGTPRVNPGTVRPIDESTVQHVIPPTSTKSTTKSSPTR